MKKIVPGESVEYERFDDYWAGKPKLKNVTLKVVNPSIVSASLKKGDIDIASITADQYPNVSKLKKYTTSRKNCACLALISDLNLDIWTKQRMKL